MPPFLSQNGLINIVVWIYLYRSFLLTAGNKWKNSRCVLTDLANGKSLIVKLRQCPENICEEGSLIRKWFILHSGLFYDVIESSLNTASFMMSAFGYKPFTVRIIGAFHQSWKKNMILLHLPDCSFWNWYMLLFLRLFSNGRWIKRNFWLFLTKINEIWWHDYRRENTSNDVFHFFYKYNRSKIFWLNILDKIGSITFFLKLFFLKILWFRRKKEEVIQFSVIKIKILTSFTCLRSKLISGICQKVGS